VVEAKADARSAWVTTKLDFFRIPRYMKQFPFAHTLTMTYRVQDGALEVHTRIDSLSDERMPVAIGFHPYFQLTDSPREDWRIAIGAKTHWKLEPRKLPTGETEPITQFPARSEARAREGRHVGRHLHRPRTRCTRARDALAHRQGTAG
jgi:aldose 1-epimerase